MSLMQEILFGCHWEDDKGMHFRNELIWQSQQLVLSPAGRHFDSSDCLGFSCCDFFFCIFFILAFFFLNIVFHRNSMAQFCNCPIAFQVIDSCEIRIMSSCSFTLLLFFLFSCQCVNVGCVNWGMWNKHMDEAMFCWRTACLMYTYKKAFKGVTWMRWALFEIEVFTSLPRDFYFCGEVTWLAEACGLPLCSAARPQVKRKNSESKELEKSVVLSTQGREGIVGTRAVSRTWNRKLTAILKGYWYMWCAA